MASVFDYLRPRGAVHAGGVAPAIGPPTYDGGGGGGGSSSGGGGGPGTPPITSQPAGVSQGFNQAPPGQTGPGNWSKVPSVSHGPGSGSLFQGWLTGDPIYQQELSQIQGAGNSDQAGLNQAVNQLMIQYGITPNLTQSAGELGLGGGPLAQLLGMINPATEKAAAQNTAQGTSILGALLDANNNALSGIRGKLAASGMFNSGENQYETGQENLKYNQGLYNDLSRMLGNFTSDQQKLAGELQSLYGAGGQWEKAINDAWSRFTKAVLSNQVALPSGVTPQQAITQGPGSIVPPTPPITTGAS